VKTQSSVCVIEHQKALAYTYAKQHVFPGFGADNIKQVAHNLVGLHSARLPTPFVSLYARLDDFKTDDLRKELFDHRSMIKLRCMRGTLHIVPLALAPIVHQATLDKRVRVCQRVYHQLSISLDRVNEIKQSIVQFVKEGPKSTDDILYYSNVSLDVFGSSQRILSKQKIKLIRTIVKHLWEEGLLCYLNESDHWGKEDRQYGYTPQIYPSLDLNSESVFEAQIELVRYHINQYGPVTEEDIYWWSGLNKSTIRKCLAYLKNYLVTIEWPGFNSEFFMTKLDFENFQAFHWQNSPWVALLAYEDSSLKGYFESRGRYIAAQHYKTLFNRIGEARASILFNGRVVGIWKWDKKKKRVFWTTFETLESSVSKELRSKIQALECFLAHSDQKQPRLL
jgi:hypothetical protein